MDYCEDEALFSGKIEGRVAVVKFKEDLLRNLTCLMAKERLFQFLDQIEKDKKVRVLLIFGAAKRIDQEECQGFYTKFATGEAGLDDLERLNNAVNQFVLRMSAFDKMVIHAGKGPVAPVFFNMGLACDWRIVGDDTIFQNPCLDMGLIPKGGGVFFFQRLMGRGVTADLLYSGRTIDAREALTLGLVNRVVPLDTLEAEALCAAQDFSQKPLRAIMGIKRLLNYPIKELADFLEHEDEVIRNSFIKALAQKR
ncbi:putative enoyl-CoA hydratase [Desulforapulum autotrophicum HRM2]|uniref:Enoyl-CoA hydratase n=1 Tax=Desulforapulum autotrophicum (strain ATCC 43914 / DSM 3382 / VKM B-1955 / HRM2) TaxID=177437 RepID=C0QHH4_DESAH|nr:enoyl-CoA hydratase-related protein [Desulforapulum autotrophicum]ACN17833.1 putative enoyl-CoA hydratase [Desulforapulum autotrophicum HRM2]